VESSKLPVSRHATAGTDLASARVSMGPSRFAEKVAGEPDVEKQRCSREASVRFNAKSTVRELLLYRIGLQK
jgi:hypothetical protein